MLRELGKSDLLEQMEAGLLVLGVAGQKLVDHYTFFAAFNAPEELRVVHGSEEIGRVGMPPAPGEHLILAGRRWCVEGVDVERREVLVFPARGRKMPWFVPTFGKVHPAIHAKMKELLLGAKEPSYLDATALEILADARRETSRIERFDPPAMTTDGKLSLFVFGGAMVQQTLHLIFSRAGLQFGDRGVGFEVEADRHSVAAALRAFAQKPDLAPLAEHADRVLNMRTLGSEKFDAFVAPDVWQKAFAREELNAVGAARAALTLAIAATK